MNHIKTFLILFIAMAAFSTFVVAQREDRILVTGRYQFRQSEINQLIEIYEWMLAGRFDQSQRQRFQNAIVKDLQTSYETAQSVREILSYYEKIKTVDEPTRQKFQRETVPQMVAVMEKEGGAANAVLLEVYRRGNSETADTDVSSDDSLAADIKTDNLQNTGGAVKISDLAGMWSTSSGTTERYKSLITGELSDPSGYVIEYEFTPNGQFKYASYSSETAYSCTSKLFVYKGGRATINGSNLTLDFAPGKRSYKFCANPFRESTIPASRKTVPFRLERGERSLKLCTTEDYGAEFCLYKVQ